MIVVGLDFSMTCPCMCFMNTEWPVAFQHSGFMYLSSKKNEQKEWDVDAATLVGKPHSPRTKEFILTPDMDSTARVIDIMVTLLSPFAVMKNKDPDAQIKFFIEGYSMGSRGRVFDLAEAMGMAKAQLWFSQIPFEIVPPTVLKKFATGKGNADKQKMYDTFVEQGNPTLMSLMFPDRAGVSSPVTDIVDSFYLAKYGVQHVTKG